MKQLLFVAFLFCSLNCFSQDPNPQLFQTWYLRSVQSNDFAPIHYVSQITPPISPTLTISNTLTFSGQGACNTFNGTATVNNIEWHTTSFSEGGADCGITIHNEFEDNYFGFMQSAGFYTIYPEGAGLGLVMGTFLFGQAVFQNTPLSTSDYDLEKIALYPNPAKTVVYLNANQLVISKIQIINSLGQSIKTINDDFEVVNVSDLATGMYILKIDTEVGTVNRKVIKE